MFKTYVRTIFTAHRVAPFTRITGEAVDEINARCATALEAIGASAAATVEGLKMRTVGPEAIRSAIWNLDSDKYRALLVKSLQLRDTEPPTNGRLLVPRCRCRAAAKFPEGLKIRRASEDLLADMTAGIIRVLLDDAFKRASESGNTKCTLTAAMLGE